MVGVDIHPLRSQSDASRHEQGRIQPPGVLFAAKQLLQQLEQWGARVMRRLSSAMAALPCQIRSPSSNMAPSLRW